MKEPLAPSPLAGLRILLVEDHADTARAMQRVLGRVGYEVRAVGSIAEAVEAGWAEPFDLLACNVGLPDGDGREILGRILERRPIRGIVISGKGMTQDVQASLDAGFVEHVVKPVNLDQLQDAIRRAMARDE